MRPIWDTLSGANDDFDFDYDGDGTANGAEYAYLMHMVKHAAEFNLYAGQAARIDDEVRPALAIE